MTGGIYPVTGMVPVALSAHLRRLPTSFGVDRRDRRIGTVRSDEGLGIDARDRGVRPTVIEGRQGHSSRTIPVRPDSREGQRSLRRCARSPEIEYKPRREEDSPGFDREEEGRCP